MYNYLFWEILLEKIIIFNKNGFTYYLGTAMSYQGRHLELWEFIHCFQTPIYSPVCVKDTGPYVMTSEIYVSPVKLANIHNHGKKKYKKFGTSKSCSLFTISTLPQVYDYKKYALTMDKSMLKSCDPKPSGLSFTFEFLAPNLEP